MEDEMKMDELEEKRPSVRNAAQKKLAEQKYQYLYSQIVVVLIILIIILLVRALNLGLFDTLKAKYNEYFGKDVPLSVSSIIEGINMDEAETTTSPPVEITTAPEPTTPPAENTPVGAGDSAVQEVSSNPLVFSGNFVSLASDTDAADTEKKEKRVERADEAASSLQSILVPVSGRITSPFGYRNHPITGVYSLHGGTDIAAAEGTPIGAALDGIVEFSGEKRSYGKCVILRHSGGLQTVYAHCSELKLAVGNRVKKGDTVALVGSTGDSTGPHLHFEIRVNGVRMNPQWILPVLE